MRAYFLQDWGKFLLVLGLVHLLGGAGCTAYVLTPGKVVGDYYESLIGLGVFVLATGASYVVAGAGLLAHRLWGCWLAAVLGAAGLIFWVWVWVWVWSRLSLAGTAYVVPPALVYGVTLAAALIWYPHAPSGPPPD